MNRILFLFLLCPAMCWADLTVKVPESVPEYELVSILVDGSDGLEIDVEVWKGPDQPINFRELKSDSGREFAFVAPPGEYVVKVYGWKTGQKPEKFSQRVRIGRTVAPVVPDAVTPLAQRIRDAASKVFSIGRAAEAKEIARVYQSVAAKAVAVPEMTVDQMLGEIRAGNREAIGEASRKAWESWAVVVDAELKPLVSDRARFVAALNEIATGLSLVQ